MKDLRLVFNENQGMLNNLDEKVVPIRIKIPHAKENLIAGLNYYLGEGKWEWLPEYDSVVDWLEDNKNKGITLIGNCGRGKTIIGAHIIPKLIEHYHVGVDGLKIVVMRSTARDLESNPDRLINYPFVSVDDVGIEGLSVDYGRKRNGFAELVDEAERKGNLLILTSNLSTDEIKKRYGDRTLDRMVSLTRCVVFKGDSMRR